MARQAGYQAAEATCRKIIEDARNGVFSPVYLLMGEEPYYAEKACDAIVEYALSDSERDFNQTVFYGLDSDAGTIASEARLYPMMAERRLVVVREAQNMKSLEELAVYCEEPMDSTVLVVLMHGDKADKRKAFYKNVVKNGVVLESPAVKDYEVDGWIVSYYRSRGLSIAPDAAVLLGESAGADLGKIVVETEKMLKNLPEGTTTVTAADVEKNVGVSRQFSVFELTKELSLHNAAKALRIATYIGSSPRFAMPMVTAALFNHFYRILKYEAVLMKNPRPDNDVKSAVLGVNPYFFREYDTAVINYPVGKCLRIMSLLEEYDYKGKGGDAGEATPEQMLMELVSKILN
ncbi:MAG: DNA polymerase III subunit delta [Bacteroidales bacterium]|nr:DNA polymerase III subunit delta [Bacteroidales bacterium]MBQ3917138.1 DNA polymerase III subunit delta [Bacteroidales bacterium]MEE3406830.1 DNA polymerase III subunit delta [Candidatus Cryptobacteroides sp.]MEE3463462.1 DNA polymerase III subunit delta [Candidatus Cryptobacteroides sp.]SKC43411.1 DNA polymerase III, delta subunit [Bacteroidales bacterium WCE2008]